MIPNLWRSAFNCRDALITAATNVLIEIKIARSSRASQTFSGLTSSYRVETSTIAEAGT
jgi:hypothetical protein